MSDDPKEKALQTLAEAYRISSARLRMWLTEEVSRAESRRRNGSRGGRPSVADKYLEGGGDRLLEQYMLRKFFSPVREDGAADPLLTDAQARTLAAEMMADEVIAAGRANGRERAELVIRFEKSIRNRWSNYGRRVQDAPRDEGDAGNFV